MKEKLIAAIYGLISLFILFKVSKFISSALWGKSDFINAVLGIFLIIFSLIISVAISQKVYSKLNSHLKKR
ncbi:hypothetical protein [Clostridium sp. Marseille-P299]|uniref:hypothetical protein n=1 Tax=Clostridium sp. Marseille-P299 TaxID=1805477 RepID=UPI0008310C95|nr:hypothetical protein [Clostridium sp. Marseille-P299]